MRECPNNKLGNVSEDNRDHSSLVAPLEKVSPKGATFGTGGGTKLLYALTNC